MSRVDYSHQALCAFLITLTFPKLAESQVAILEAPFSENYILSAMAHVATVKAPGSDGLPIKLYNLF